MKGLRVVVPKKECVRLEEFEVDETSIGPREVLIRSHFTTISPGTELAIYTALDRGVYKPGSWCCYPFIPGYICVGEIINKGNDVKDLSLGDIVYCFGKHASLNRICADSLVLPVPDNLDHKITGLTRMATIAMTARRVSKAAQGDIAVVMGLGLVGNFTAQLFELSGVDTVGVDVVPSRLERAGECGASHLVNPQESDLKQEIMRITKGRGANLAVEAIGSPSVTMSCIDLLARHGELILLGSPRADYEANVYLLLWQIHSRGITLKGALEWLFPILETDGAQFSMEGNSKYVFRTIAEQKLIVAPLLTHVIKPHEFASAYEGLLNDKDKYLGVVVDWREVAPEV